MADAACTHTVEPRTLDLRALDGEQLATLAYFGDRASTLGDGDAREALVDALTNLRHFAAARGIEFDSAAASSLMHFDAERRACPCGGTLDRFGRCTRGREAAARLDAALPPR